MSFCNIINRSTVMPWILGVALLFAQYASALDMCAKTNIALSPEYKSSELVLRGTQDEHRWSTDHQCACRLTSIARGPPPPETTTQAPSLYDEDDDDLDAVVQVGFIVESEQVHAQGSNSGNGTDATCAPTLLLSFKRSVHYVCPVGARQDNRTLQSTVLLQQHDELMFTVFNPKLSKVKMDIDIVAVSGNVAIECGLEHKPMLVGCPCGEAEEMVALPYKNNDVPLSKRFGIGIGAALGFLLLIALGFLIHWYLSNRQMKRIERSMEESKINQAYITSSSDPGYAPQTRYHDPELNLNMRTGTTSAKSNDQGSTDSGLYSIPSEYRLKNGYDNSDSTAASLAETPSVRPPRTPQWNTPGVKLSPTDIGYNYARHSKEDLTTEKPITPKQSTPMQHSLSYSSITGTPALESMSGNPLGGSLTGSSQLGPMSRTTPKGSLAGIPAMSSITGAPQLDSMAGAPALGSMTGAPALGSMTGAPALGSMTGAPQLGPMSGGDGGASRAPPPQPPVRSTPQRQVLAARDLHPQDPHHARLMQQHTSSASPMHYSRPMYPIGASSGLNSRTSSVDDLDYRSLSYMSQSLASSQESFNTTRSNFSQTDV